MDAIFAASDLAAIGAIRALEQSGRRVGRASDVAVIGFDDIPAAAEHRPPLTHRAAADRRAGHHDDDAAAAADRGRGAGRAPTVLPVELVLRETA